MNQHIKYIGITGETQRDIVGGINALVHKEKSNLVAIETEHLLREETHYFALVKMTLHGSQI